MSPPGDRITFEREDWTAFRTVEGLQRRAGTSIADLAAVVVKELVDNALDAAGDCELGLAHGVITVQDRGEGIPGNDQEIARIFSMNRPQISSKYLRLPTRGSLGNGLRVVVGAVVATGGKLFVSTRGRRLEVIPDLASGQSEVIRGDDFPIPGTRIEVLLGAPLVPSNDDLWMGMVAIDAARARESQYIGKTSPHWYDLDSFHELVMSVQNGITTRELIAIYFDGCSRKASDIVGGFSAIPAKALCREEAGMVLCNAKKLTSKVNPQRLGETGGNAFPGEYARKAAHALMPRGTDGSQVTIPVAVEAWASIDSTYENSGIIVLVNGSPCVTDAFAQRMAKSKETLIHGGGMSFRLKTGNDPVLFHVNIITPFIPITSDGKSPSLGTFRLLIEPVMVRAWKRATKGKPKSEKVDIKSVVFENMDAEIAVVSSNRTYRFNWRQVFYRVRPIVAEKTGQELGWTYFSQTLVREYLKEFGDEPMAYRDSRGTFYMPHGGASFPLGTMEVEKYDRPSYLFNKVLVIEKEGFFEALKTDGWPERHDCALLTSKGQPTDAARDLIDLIGEAREPVQVFLIHDCDAAGTIIFQSFQDETAARPKRSLEIVNLGLDVKEARQLADGGIVQIENVSRNADQPVARYVNAQDWDWLQSHRVELNALTTEAFIDWLDAKMGPYDGKVIPPVDHMADHLHDHLQQRIRDQITERILAEAKIDDQVNAVVAGLADQLASIIPTLAELVADSLEDDEGQHWSDAIEALADGIDTADIGGPVT
ncbi:MAG TPA: ATP-binding protein [Isosphaeraceae bacterium]|nr:ATP-binding protein [Isosphaeraceae bacterium]